VSASDVLIPVIFFAAFMAYFAVRARRDGKPVRQWIDDRNHRTFTNLRPGWWIPHVAFALSAWTAIFIASGFKPVLFLALPVVVLWVPLWTLALRRLHGRTP
jgi:Na+/H+-dicarboxylate symporter